ncbi:MAG: methionyl-tRNA formyltransferase [Rickettsiales bacterium]
MRIVFMGTPAFAVPTLAALIASAHEVVGVYSQPPRPAGRGMKLKASPVQVLAEQHGIPVFTPTSLKAAEAKAEFSALTPDVAVVAAYGLLLPQAILDAPRLGCLNIHPSDLPRGRGAAPIQRTLMAGDTATACCIMQMEAGLDTGPVLSRTPYPIAPGTNAGTLHDAMALLGAEMVLELLARDHLPTAVAQASTGVTYAAKITKADRVVDWNQPASQIICQLRGLAPQPAAITLLAGEVVKLFSGIELPGDASKPPGMALDTDLLINAGGGTAVRLTQLQRPGRLVQDAKTLLQALPIPAGSMLGTPDIS